MITTILWDIDGTLLNFHAAEYAAIKALFAELSLGICTDEMVKRYSEINDIYWKKLERGELTKERILVERFEKFFSEYGIETSVAQEFNEKYQVRLGDTIVYCDDSLNIIKSLKGKVLQYAVSNGTVIAQTRKLERSGLGALFDGVFLSEQIGVEKPNAEFFDKVFSTIGEDKRAQSIIVGDSLTSDILGGNNAGIMTCWYNPQKKEAPDIYSIDYVISNLCELEKIICK